MYAGVNIILIKGKSAALYKCEPTDNIILHDAESDSFEYCIKNGEQ